MKLAVFPNGLRVNLDMVLTIVSDFRTLTFPLSTNPTLLSPVYPTNDVAGVLKQLYDFIVSKESVLFVKDLATPTVYLFNVTPTVFSVSSDTLIVTGTGFTPAMDTPVLLRDNGLGDLQYGNVLYLEDPTAKDSNGFCFQITYINPTTISAVLLNDGDAAAVSPGLLYYQAVYGIDLVTPPILTPPAESQSNGLLIPKTVA